MTAIALLPADAQAGVARTEPASDGSGQVLRFDAGPGEENRLVIELDELAATYTLTESGSDAADFRAPLTAGPGCLQITAQQVRCSVVSTRFRSIVELGDRDDQVEATGAGDDDLRGGAGSDLLQGGGGSDTLVGGPGDDGLDGQGGDDLLSADPGNDDLAGGGGTDLADYSARTGSQRIVLGADDSQGSGDVATGEDDDFFGDIEHARGGSGDDEIRAADVSSVLEGGLGDDTLSGGRGLDTLTGGGGDDTLFDSQLLSHDVFDGGPGADEVSYALRWVRVTVDLSQGVGGAPGELDQLVGVENAETSVAEGDVLLGDNGPNRLDGGGSFDAVRDVVKGRGGNDRLDGGVLHGGPGNDVLGTPGSAGDVVDYSESPARVVVDLTDSAPDGAVASGELDQIDPGAIELIGSGFDDDLRGSPRTDAVRGGPGADELHAVDRAPFRQELHGDGGDDRLFASPGGASLQGGDGADRLAGPGGQSGGAGPDILRGSAGNDSLDGGFGDDLLTGLAGGDRLVGGPGSDTVDYSERVRRVEAYLDNSWRFSGDREAGEMDELEDVESFLGGAGADLVHGNDQRNDIRGGAGADVIHGARGADTLAGEGGADELIAGEGPDVVEGGAGDDRLDGGGRSGVDELDGGDGSDTALYSGRTEPVHIDLASPDGDGEEGEVDELSAIENVVGGAGNDVIRGDDSANRLEGGAGNDEVTGRLGSDELFGDAGDDSLMSADGAADQNACGDGNDSAVADDADTTSADCETVEHDVSAQSARSPEESGTPAGAEIAPVGAGSPRVAAWSPGPGPSAELDRGAQARLSRMGPDGDPAFGAFGSSIAYDSQNDRYLVVWYGKDRAADGYEIWGRLLDGNGNPVTEQFQISQTLPEDPSRWAQEPAATHNVGTGEFLVAWSAPDRVRAQRLDGDGAEVGVDDFAVSRGPGQLPAVGVDSGSGQYLVAWASPASPWVSGATREIRAQRLDAAGQELGEDDFQVSEDEGRGGTGSSAWAPAVAFNPGAREFLVAWIGDGTGSSLSFSGTIFGQRLTRLGQEVGPEDVQLSSTFANAGDLELAYNARADEYLAAWSGRREGHGQPSREAMIQRVSPQGNEIGADDQPVSRTESGEAGPGFGAVSVGLAVNPASGDYLVTWAAGDHTNSGSDMKDTVFGQRLTAGGRQFGRDDFRISEMGPSEDSRFGASNPAAAYGGGSHGFLVTWTADHDGDGSVDGDLETFGRRLGHFEGDPPEGDPGADRDQADTSFARAPAEHSAQASASFELRSSEEGSSFECRWSDEDWEPCDDTVELTGLPDGRHRFEARAVDRAGNTDLEPAAHAWRVDTRPPDIQNLTGPSSRTTSPEARFEFGAAWDEGDPYAPVYECRLDGGAWTRCGEMSASPRSDQHFGLSEGAHEFQVRATDRVGNVDPSPATHRWTVEGPSIAIVAGPHGATPSREATFHFRGTSPGGRFECSLDGAEPRPCSSPITYAALSEGPHTFDVSDAEGVFNHAERNWVVDDRPPETTITEGPSSQMGVVRISGTEASFRVEASEAATLECRMDNGPWEACGAVADYENLPDGGHSFEARATDTAGNLDASPAALRFWTDNRPPESAIHQGPSGTTSQRDATFEFSADEEATLECQLDGDEWDRCESPLTYTDLPDGTHTFRVRAADLVGHNERTPAARTWRVDTHAPSTRIYGGPPERTAERSAAFELGASEPASFECRLDGGEWSACEPEVRLTGLAAGEHRFEARAIDDAGEQDLSPAYRDWVVEGDAPPRAPETRIEAAPARVTSADWARFRFASSVTGASFECSVDGGAWVGCPADFELHGLADGTHGLAVRAVSERTDQTPATYGWRVDTTAPETVVDTGPSRSSTSADAVFTFSSSEPGSTFACSLDAGPWEPCASPSQRNGLAPGNHTFEVRASDEVGNTDSSPARREWTVARQKDPVVPQEDASPTAPASPGTQSVDSQSALRSDARRIRERLMRLGPRRLLLRRGATLLLDAVEPGEHRLMLIHDPPSGAAARRLLVAQGSSRAAQPGPNRVRLRLTRAGRRLLGGRSRVKLTLRITFRPLSGEYVSERIAVPLRAPPVRTR